MTTNRSGTATFTTVGPTPRTLTVGVTGSGSVTSSPAGISCPGTCSASFPNGTAVTLTPAAGAGSTFTGWSNGCTGTGTGACVVTLNANATVNEAFTPVASGNLVVTVASSPATVTAGRAAQETYTVTNTGDGSETNAGLVINFPPGSTIVSNDPSQGTCTVGPASLTCSFGTTGGTFSLPNRGPGAPISLTTSALPAGYCGGHTCRGRLLTLSPFAGYTDPQHPAVLDISLDSSRVALWGPSFNVWVQKEDSYAAPTLVPDCKKKVVWAKFWFKHHHHGYFFWYIKWVKKVAKPSPCVAKRYIDSHGDSHTRILILSGDPKFARR